MKNKRKVEKKSNSASKYTSLVINNETYTTTLTRKYADKKPYVEKNPNQMLAFIPGTITEVFVKEGQPVVKGQDLLVLEAMKMLNMIKAPHDGVVAKLNVQPGETVSKNHMLVEVE